MGTPATCNAYAIFDTPENQGVAFLKFSEWVDEANKKTDVSFDIGNLDCDVEDRIITYSVGFGRVENCIWQCEQIRDFFKTQKGIQSIEQDVMTCHDSINWYKDDDEEIDSETIAGIKALPQFSK